jgi:FkbM family methyltransferase
VRGTLRRLRRAAGRGPERKLVARKLLRAFAEAYPRAVFVEIGSNDGEQHDHLQPLILSSAWRGVMVEPVPYVFERLRRNYRGVEGVSLENAAVADRDGALPFYYLREASAEERAGLPDWYDGIGSFSREAVLSHASHIPDIEGRLVSEEVPSLTFESLCEKHGLSRVDLLLIDAEGYDWELIRTIDFERRAPRLLIYEHYHLGPREHAECRSYVEERGYETMEEGFDTFCLLPDDDGLTRAWRRMRPALPGLVAYEEDRP